MPACTKCNAVFRGKPSTCPQCDAHLGKGSIWTHEDEPVKLFGSTTSVWEWLLFASLATACFAYAIYGFFTGEMYLPGKRRTLTYQGSAALLLASAFLAAALHFSVGLFSYRGRPELTPFHEAFSKYTKYVGVALFFAAILTHQVNEGDPYSENV